MKINIVEKKYDDRVILSDFEINLVKKDIVCIVGRSGTGKSTLLNIIAGFDTEYVGEKDEANIAYVGQTVRLIERFTVSENCNITQDILSVTKFDEYVQLLNLDRLVKNKVNVLSGGQRQRVVILRALCMNVDYIIMDEPTSNLDAKTSADFMNLLYKITLETNVGFLISSHDNSVIDNSSIVYTYKDKKFISNFDAKSTVNIGSKYELKSLRKITKLHMRHNFFNYMLMPMMLVIIFLILSFASLKINSFLFTEYDLVMNSLSSDMIAIHKDAEPCSSDVECDSERDFTNISFSNEEIENIKNIEGVSNVAATVSNDNSMYLKNGSKLSELPIDEEIFYDKELKYLQKVRRDLVSRGDLDEYLEVPTYMIKYGFSSVTANPLYDQAYGYLSVNYLLNYITYGSNNFVNENDIVIPYNLAVQIAHLKNIKIEDLINLEVTLPLLTQEYEEYESKFNIIGIYDDTKVKTFGDLGKIYINEGFTPTVDNLYSTYLEQYSNNKLFNETYPNYEVFKNYNDTGYTDVIIEVENGYEDKIQEILLEQYPDDYVLSRDLYVQKYFKDEKLNIVITKIIFYILSMLISIVSVISMNKFFFKILLNDKIVFRQLGYSDIVIKNYINTIFTLYTCLFIFISFIIFLST